MRHLGSRAWRAAALAAPLAAASLAVGPAVAHAGVTRPAAGPAWHKLFAINGWSSSQSRYGTGAPSWAVKNGVVYLSGSVHRSSSSASTLFAVLPPQARPAHVIWLTVYTLNESLGTLAIKPNGKMFATSTPQTRAAGFTSLAGISFLAKSVKPHSLGLENSWHSAQSVWNSGDPGYVVRGGIVYLSGALAGGSSELFAVLPAAARPKSVEYISGYTFEGTHGTLQINPNGNMGSVGTVLVSPSGTIQAYSVPKGNAREFTSLATISFALKS